jgi:hypothetical protein
MDDVRLSQHRPRSPHGLGPCDVLQASLNAFTLCSRVFRYPPTRFPPRPVATVDRTTPPTSVVRWNGAMEAPTRLRCLPKLKENPWPFRPAYRLWSRDSLFNKTSHINHFGLYTYYVVFHSCGTPSDWAVSTK